MKAVIDLQNLYPLYGGDLGDCFILVSDPDIRKYLLLDFDGIISTANVLELEWLGPSSRHELVALLNNLRVKQKKCSVLLILSDEYRHFELEQINNAKIAAISFFSSCFTTEILEEILEIVAKTDYCKQLIIENRVIDFLDSTESIILYDERYCSKLIFRHRLVQNWFSLHGPLDFSDQTILPTGEISALTAPSGFLGYSNFDLNGEVVIQGFPVVHRGNHNVSREKATDYFERLSSMKKFPVIAVVKNGEIQSLCSPFEGENYFLQSLDKMFSQDARYCKIHEIGIGTNFKCKKVIAGNFSSNERYPGLHFGIGLGGYTELHVDLVCPHLDILSESNCRLKMAD